MPDTLAWAYAGLATYRRRVQFSVTSWSMFWEAKSLAELLENAPDCFKDKTIARSTGELYPKYIKLPGYHYSFSLPS